MTSRLLTGVGEVEFEDGTHFEATYNLALRQRMIPSRTGMDPGETSGRGTIRPLLPTAMTEKYRMECGGKKAILFLGDGRRVPLTVIDPGPVASLPPRYVSLGVAVDGKIIEANTQVEE